MEDFLNQFKNNLGNRPEPAFERRDWKDMERRLDQHGRARSAFLWWWAALPLLILLLGSNAWFYQQLENAQEKISSIEKRTTSTIHQIDTIYLSKTIYQTDTIYKTRVVKEYLNRFNYALQPNESTTEKSHVHSEKLLIENKKVKGSINGMINENSETVAGKFNLNKLIKIELSELIYHKNTLLPFVEKDAASDKRKKFRDYVYAMQPKEVQAGIFGGLVLPMANGLESQLSYTTGVEGVLAFNTNLQMWANASYSKLRLSTDVLDDKNGIPTVSPPTPGSVFHAAELPLNVLQFSVGMQYVFKSSKKIQPIFGVGFGGTSLLPYQITYDFEDEINNSEFVFEKDRNGTELTGNLLFLRAGILHEINNKWNVVVRGSYRHNLENSRFESPHVFGLHAGLFRRF